MTKNEKCFIDATNDILIYGKGYKSENLSKKGFEVIGDDQKGILIFGINPGGDVEDADAEEDKTYLYYIPGLKNISHRTYSTYYQPIFEFAEEIVGKNNVKWDWCNRCDIESIFGEKVFDKKEEKELQQNKVEIEKFSKNSKNKNYTIYLGEFFYYHQTKQNKLVDIIKNIDEETKAKHMIDMLNKHIYEIEEKGNSVDFIYINNAKASHLLYNAIIKQSDDNKTVIEYENKDPKYKLKKAKYKLFFGAMLSRGTMDSFSKERLIAEIKSCLKNKAK